jgi:histidinol-phosphatase (PHP family)
MLVDYHVHLERAGLSRENALRFVKCAQALGLSDIAFTEHAYNFVECAPMLRRPEYVSTHGHAFRIGEYVSLVEGLKGEGFPVKLGIEMDYVPETCDEAAAFLKRHPFDLVIGSVHWIDEWGFDITASSWDGVDVEWAYSRYFELACAAAASGFFDVIGHPDVIKVFGARMGAGARPGGWGDAGRGGGCGEHRGGFLGDNCGDARLTLAGYYDALVSATVASGTCLEVSSAGLRRPVGEAYPAMDLLRMACERGVAVTLASDAHEPEEVGSRYDELAAWARAAGYRTITVFDGRVPRQVEMG